jgi:hypothetical protein
MAATTRVIRGIKTITIKINTMTKTDSSHNMEVNSLAAEAHMTRKKTQKLSAISQ